MQLIIDDHTDPDKVWDFVTRKPIMSGIIPEVPPQDHHLFNLELAYKEKKYYEEHGNFCPEYLALTKASYLTILKSAILKSFQRASAFITKHWKALALGLIAAAGIITAAVCLFIKAPEEEEEIDITVTESGYYEKVNVRPARRIVQLRPNAVGQIADKQLEDQIKKAIQSYVNLTVTAEADDGIVISKSKAIHLVAGAFCTELHSLYPALIEEKGKQIDPSRVTITISRGTLKKTIPYSEVYVVPWYDDEYDVDQVTIFIPQKYWMRGPDITKFFIKESEADDRLMSNTMKVKPHEDFSGYHTEQISRSTWRMVHPKNPSIKASEPVVAIIPGIDGKFVTTDAIIASLNTNFGDCHDLYVVDNPKSERKFFGFHVAKLGPGEAVALVVTQEMLQRFVHSKCPWPAVTQGGLLDIGGTNELIELTPSLEHFKYVPTSAHSIYTIPASHKRLFNYPPRDSNFVETGLFPDEPKERVPVKMYPTESHDPLAYVVNKMSVVDPDIPPTLHYKVAAIAARSIKVDLARRSNLPGVLTLNEAVNSHINQEAKPNTRMSTSAGFGFSNSPPGKHGLLEESQDPEKPWKPKKVLIDTITLVLSYVSLGIAVMLPYKLTMKSELRILIKEFFPRGFKAGSFILNLLVTMYFGSAIDIYLQNGNALRHAVGRNFNGSLGATHAKNLDGKPCIGYDIINNDNTQHRISLFDSLEDLEIMSRILDQNEFKRNNLPAPIAALESQKLNVIRATIIEMVISPVTVIQDKIYTLMSTVPSGGILTTLCNTDIDTKQYHANVLHIMYEKQHPQYMSLMNSPKNLYQLQSLSFGDDISSVEYAGGTYEDYEEAGKLLGRKYQQPDKDRTSIDSKPLSDMKTFLSRDPIKIGKFWHWKLPESTIRSIVHFREKSIIPGREMNRILCDSALAEWFHYGPERFKAEKHRYDVELTRLDCDVTTLTYAKALSDHVEGLGA